MRRRGKRRALIYNYTYIYIHFSLLWKGSLSARTIARAHMGIRFYEVHSAGFGRACARIAQCADWRGGREICELYARLESGDLLLGLGCARSGERVYIGNSRWDLWIGCIFGFLSRVYVTYIDTGGSYVLIDGNFWWSRFFFNRMFLAYFILELDDIREVMICEEALGRI